MVTIRIKDDGRVTLRVTVGVKSNFTAVSCPLVGEEKWDGDIMFLSFRSLTDGSCDGRRTKKKSHKNGNRQVGARLNLQAKKHTRSSFPRSCSFSGGVPSVFFWPVLLGLLFLFP